MTTQNLTMLIVDDEASIRNGLYKAIQWKDLNITVLSTAADGIEALAFIKEHNPDIVITDIKMPICDGLTLISKVIELKMDTKFIIISGYDDFKYAQTAIKYGVKSYLLKPLKKEELINEVKSVYDEIIVRQQNKNIILKDRSNFALGKDALREKFFSRLLENEYIQQDELLHEIENYSLSIQNSPLQVIVFTYELPDSKKHSTFSKEDNSLFKYAVKNIIEEMLGQIPSVTFEYGNKYIVSIVNTPFLQNKNITSCYDFCKRCISAIENYIDVSIYAGIGDAAASLSSASESYRIALESLSYMLYDTSQRIFDSSIISNTIAPNIAANNMDNSELIDAIFRGSMDDMLTLTNKFFESFFTIGTPPPSFIRGMCIYLVIDVKKGLAVYLEKDNDLFNEQPYDIINNLSFLPLIKKWIIALFTDYINYFRNNYKLRRDPIIEKAKDYINKNIFKKIKADEVAAHVNLSENYFTVYFKEKTHENFSDYIINLKMINAKNLLKASNKSINEISFLLGYEDYRSFNRVFKKYTGKTPTEFRQMYENKS